MKKIMLKSALLTLGVVAGLALLVFAFLSLAFPGTVAGWCEQLGNYDMAANYAWLDYKYSGKVSDLARCAEDAVKSGKDDYIVKYCVRLIDNSEFEEYCVLRDETLGQFDEELNISYRQYVYGAASAAYYRSGNLPRALGFAVEAVNADYNRTDFSSADEFDLAITNFPVTNAFGTLATAVISKKDGASSGEVLKVLQKVSVEDAEQANYLKAMKSALEQIG